MTKIVMIDGVKTVHVPAKHLANCSVKTALATNLSFEEVRDLVHWCDGQAEGLWHDMSLQEALNVYRASAEWISWEGWVMDDRPAAHRAWDKAVIDPQNQMSEPAYRRKG